MVELKTELQATVRIAVRTATHWRRSNEVVLTGRSKEEERDLFGTSKQGRLFIDKQIW